jgi:hypothetical protein
MKTLAFALLLILAGAEIASAEKTCTTTYNPTTNTYQTHCF